MNGYKIVRRIDLHIEKVVILIMMLSESSGDGLEEVAADKGLLSSLLII